LRWIEVLGCLDPDAELRWLRIAAAQPPVHDSCADRDAAVAALDAAIGALERDPKPQAEPGALGGRRLFYLAYAGADDTSLLRRFGAVTSRLATSPKPPRGPRSAPEIAIVTGLAHDHSVWNAIGRWWGQCLADAGMPCRLYDLNGGVSGDDRAYFTEVEAGPRPFPKWRDLIAGAGHRVVLYPEIGIEPTALYLANHRLAPTQINSWGHPATSGLPTIDGFLGSAMFDPEGAETQYSERLVRLPGIGVETGRSAPSHVRDPDAPSGRPTALLCQSVFKYLPDFDDLLAAIAKRVPDLRIVIVRTGAPEVFDRYIRRLTACFARSGLAYADYVTVVERMSKPDFQGLLGRVDVYLDPPSFSGFNTALMALAAGLPVVTLAGDRLRERLAAGILTRLAVTETVTASREAYVETAALLLGDRRRARALGAAGKERLPRLADDPAAVRMFVETVRRGIT
jgi:glycosyltransferase involved in cell wall biosynthesis